MVTCSCGKTIDKAPSWLQSVQVEFVCNNCPNRKLKNIAFITLETEGPVKDAVHAPEELEVIEDEEEA